MTYQMHIKEWVREGIAIGERRGAHDARVQTAYTAIKMGMSTNDISKLTGLPLAEIQSLANPPAS